MLAPSWGDDLRELDAAEAAAGAKVDLFGYYQGWANGERFDRERAEAVTRRGAVPVVAWEPYDWLKGTNQPEFALARIIRGDHDAYVRRWARDAAAWGKPLLLRFAYEMNGDWMPWSEGVNGNRRGEYVEAWRHVHDIFTAEGAGNVSWLWSPNVEYAGSTPLRGLYPGDRYVDWMGLSGYNWGVGVSHFDAWMSFDQVFAPTLDQLRSIATKPILISETASTEKGGDKAAWIRDLFPSLARHPDIAGFTWFNYDKETDWRIQSSSSARQAFGDSVRRSRSHCRSLGSVAAQRVDTSDPAVAAVAVSRSRFGRSGSARHVVLARDDEFADALAGSTLTGSGPLLYSRSGGLPSAVRAEIDRVLPSGGRVYLLGGTQALSDAVRADLERRGYRVVRLAGRDRVETALAVAGEVRRLHGGDRVVVARAYGSGDDPTQGWADSVAVGSWAARTRVPVLLTGSDRLHPAVAAWLRDDAPRRSYVIGGAAALSATVERSLPEPSRIAGATRLETATRIATQLWRAGSWDARQFVVVNGQRADGWAFGLVGAGLGADRLAPVLLVGNSSAPDGARALVRGGCAGWGTELVLLGSSDVVTGQVRDSLTGAC